MMATLIDCFKDYCTSFAVWQMLFFVGFLSGIKSKVTGYFSFWEIVILFITVSIMWVLVQYISKNLLG